MWDITRGIVFGFQLSHLSLPGRPASAAESLPENITALLQPSAYAGGNQRHFPKSWKKTKIITSREFISLAAPHLIKREILKAIRKRRSRYH